MKRARPFLLILACCSLSAKAAGAVTTADLQLPADRPAAFAVSVVHDEAPRRLVLERHTLRAAAFTARVWRSEGSEALFAPEPPATYRGHVEGEPSARVVAHLGPHGLTATVAAEGLRVWGVRPAASGDGSHVVFDEERSIERPVDCGVRSHVPEGSPLGGSAPRTFPGQHLSQVAFDVDHDYYLLKGASVQNSIDAVEAIMNEVDFFYARDVEITYEITEIIVRTSQFYFPTGGGHLLDLFRNEWNTNQAAVVRDQAHLMTNKNNIEFGGLAYVGAVCNAWSYGWSLDSSNIVGHELGHNWGSGHCHDLAPCNNMCGGCFFIAPETKDIMTAYRDSLACLDDAGAYPAPLPPYAHPETLTLSRDELAALTDAAFDVLGNDHDGNLDPLSIDAFDATTEWGGTVSLSPGSGPDGRDELIYSPPSFVFPGEDVFTYTVGDGTGLQQTGSVTVRAPARLLAGYWRLDDASGSVAEDASELGRNGATEGSPLWVAGLYEGALRLDGVDDAVNLPPLHLRSNTVTLSAWVQRIGSQNPWAGLIFSRDGNTIAGLSVGNAHELRYHWNGTHWSWDSGLVVPDHQWVFVALVLEPHQATLYLHDGSLQSAVHAVAHGIEEFDGTTKLGHDTDDESRRFRGILDDVRIHDHALSSEEIADLAALGGPAVAPVPADGGRYVPQVGGLSWLAGLAADSHDVYFGQDYVAVRDATPGSLEHTGNQASTILPIAAPDPGQVYSWRVDEVVAGDVVPGEVWLYTRVASGGHWPLDETSGSQAADAEADNDGTYVSGVVLGEPGATPGTGTSVYFDGVDDHVEIPPLDVGAAELSITGWARRDGAQHDWAGMVFSRAGSTTAGISTRVAGDLRYHWNDAYWDWHSGLKLPDGEWAFFALVVRGDMATIYVGDDVSLSSASNATLHGIEEFDGPIDLGKDGTTSRFFKGWLDEVRIWRTALSPREVEVIYEQSFAAGAGEVADGEDAPPLRLDKGAGDELLLTWSPSCLASDTDYGIYEGTLGDFTSHVDAGCSTAGATSATVSPAAGDRYFLVVPQSESREGSYGRAGNGTARLPGVSSCLPQQVAPCL